MYIYPVFCNRCQFFFFIVLLKYFAPTFFNLGAHMLVVKHFSVELCIGRYVWPYGHVRKGLLWCPRPERSTSSFVVGQGLVFSVLSAGWSYCQIHPSKSSLAEPLPGVTQEQQILITMLPNGPNNTTPFFFMNTVRHPAVHATDAKKQITVYLSLLGRHGHHCDMQMDAATSGFQATW